MKYKVNDKQFKYFIERCEYWKHILGVRYDIEYARSLGPTVRATVGYSIGCANATIRLALTWEIPATNEMLDRTALHEVAHLLMSPLTEICIKFYATDYIIELEHSIISGIENMLGR